MKPQMKVGYRIYIAEGGTKFYLRDWIVCDQRDNLVLSVDRHYAIRFKKWDTAKKYRDKMILLGYHPHIEAI